jgi:hypothetical protein
MRIARITRGWAVALAALTIGVYAFSVTLGGFFHVLVEFTHRPMETLVVSLLFAGLAAAMENREWGFSGYATIGACLGAMLSVIVGAWSIDEASLVGENGLWIILGLTAYGVTIGALTLLAYRLGAGIKENT